MEYGSTMVGCFFAADDSPVYCARSGQEQNVKTSKSYEDGVPTDIPQDFSIPSDKKVVVRVPLAATKLLIGPDDSFFGDNTNDGYGVLITFPNRHLATPDTLIEEGDPDKADVQEGEPDAPNILDANPVCYPTATTFLASPFDDGAVAPLAPQLRGWYYKKRSVPIDGSWLPGWSGWGHVRKNGQYHAGWDVFSPRGSKLFACVGPAKLTFSPDVPGYGKTANLSFLHGKVLHTVTYSHCGNFVGNARTVAAGELIAISGCSGNAKDEHCGEDFAGGGRTDHVHVGVYLANAAKKGKDIDPARVLHWILAA
ncbi:hypothetical protein NKH69_09990 [Mesorhizobium sp. M0976]|uniref:M23 family metallopeptidase n=1 Tax=Mesorhizobium sp. M0976 TaxID=2957038 RepID=UPI003334B393